jgi:hypothetical protein
MANYKESTIKRKQETNEINQASQPLPNRKT